MENTRVPVSVGGKKVAVRGVNEFRGWKDRPGVFVDNFEIEALSPRDACCEPHIPFLSPAVYVDAGPHAMAAQIGEDQARIVTAGKSAAHAIAKAARNSTEITVE